MTRNLAIGGLIGFALTVLGLALWGGRSQEPSPPVTDAIKPMSALGPGSLPGVTVERARLGQFQRPLEAPMALERGQGAPVVAPAAPVDAGR